MCGKNIPLLSGIQTISKMQAITLRKVTVCEVMHYHPYFLIQINFRKMCVGIFMAGGGRRSGGLWSCRTTQGSRLSFHPSIHQQPQRNDPLPGSKLNNNQSAVDLTCPDMAYCSLLRSRESDYFMSFCNNVICGSLLSERFFLGTFISLKCSLGFFSSMSPNSSEKKNMTFNTKKSCNVMHVMILYQNIKSHETLLSPAFFGQNCCSGNSLGYILLLGVLQHLRNVLTCCLTEKQKRSTMLNPCLLNEMAPLHVYQLIPSTKT